MKYNYTKNLSLLSILTFVVTVAISFKCSTAEKSKDDLTEYKLKGKVKFFKEFSYEAINSFGNLEKGKRVRENLYENDLYVGIKPLIRLIDNSSLNHSSKSSFNKSLAFIK